MENVPLLSDSPEMRQILSARAGAVFIWVDLQPCPPLSSLAVLQS